MNTEVEIALACGSVPFACFGLSRVKLRRLLRAGLLAQAPKGMIFAHPAFAGADIIRPKAACCIPFGKIFHFAQDDMDGSAAGWFFVNDTH